MGIEIGQGFFGIEFEKIRIIYKNSSYFIQNASKSMKKSILYVGNFRLRHAKSILFKFWSLRLIFWHPSGD